MKVVNFKSSFTLIMTTGMLLSCSPVVNSPTDSGFQSAATTDRGSAWDLTTAFPGAGNYTGIAPALTAADVCSSKTFLGIPGTASCNSVSSENSMAYRSDSASVDLSNPGTRNRSTLAQEAAGALVASGSALVPNPKYDTDGRYTNTGTTVKRNYLETVKGRPTKVCGLSGTNDQRVADCAGQNGTQAIYEGSKYGQNGESDWKLVTLYSTVPGAIAGDNCSAGPSFGCYEIWRDETTKQIWSELLNNNGPQYNWFQAAGYAKSTSSAADTFYESAGPTATGRAYVPQCPSFFTDTCQPDIPISACADATALAGANGVATYQNPDGTNGTFDEGPYKGNLTGTSHQWRLPTSEDFQLANAHGIRKVVKMYDGYFWTATSHSSDKSKAWYFASDYGFLGSSTRNIPRPVICVGR